MWQSHLIVPAGAVPLFLDALEAEGVSVAAFEEAAGEVGEAPLWRIELLHAGAPDRPALAAKLAALAEHAALPRIDLRLDPLPSEDWLARTVQQFPPQRVGRFWIHGSHIDQPAPEGSVALLIDAGLAFGSGEHASTRGCLLVLDRLGARGRLRRVLDLGCGSGILAIAAAKLEARRVLAADNDPVAVAAAAQNASRNDVRRRVFCAQSEGFASPAVRRGAPYDLILANILAEPLARMARPIARYLASNGLVVLAGLLQEQAGGVLAAYRAHRLRVVAQIDEPPWTTLVLGAGRARAWLLLGRGRRAMVATGPAGDEAR